eukprot:CAMPEP_0202960646 /NCGR_PEP_ID=MMETSP1396-20130829/4798_1 /ASSEMBLY_ACC=CAM_ASM_000872 /TAXON_ID= /ORGANISM="Pseudokeronopsis sp., Strain Brazil" /LENGTH=109 /DNA_ID=CAMNT_0049680003 /DNA_START=447 /DNA_END=776 /DNA_ORIENTATION=-
MYLPSSPEIVIYTYFKYVSFTLGMTTFIGYFQKSPYTNIWLSIYGVGYAAMLVGMWVFFSTKIDVIKTWGEGINVLMCCFLVYGIFSSKDEEETSGDNAKDPLLTNKVE